MFKKMQPWLSTLHSHEELHFPTPMVSAEE